MPMDAHDIESMIKAAISDAEVTIRDLAGDGDHYAATVISEIVPRQIPRPAAPDRLPVAARPDGRRAACAGAADRGSRGLVRSGGAGGAMAGDNERGALFRPIVPNQHSRVTYAELFFDLVFVFAVTQVSHTLLGRFTPLGAVQTTMLFLAVWWVWVYTSWITNWLNPETTPVRILLFLLMLGGLVLSTSIPKAFKSRGLWFAIAYAAMQVGKTVFLWASTPPGRTLARMNAVRITAWLSVSAIFWIAGGLAEGHSRLAFWAVALTIEYVSPAVRFWIPKYGASAVADWVVEGGHMAERCAGFIIIALGKSIVVTGATFADLPWTRATVSPLPRPSSARSRCGGSISTRALKPAPSRFQGPASRGGWRGSPIPICTCRSWPASFSRRSPMTLC